MNQPKTDPRPTISHRELEQMNAGRTRLYLVRHGELVTSAQWLYVGHMEALLNDTGRRQLELMAGRLAPEPIDAVLASDLKRTMESAEIICRVTGHTPEPVRAFREISLGQWEGLSRDQIVAKYPEDFELRSRDIVNYRISGGESFADVRDRVIPELQARLERSRGKNILLVAHGGVNRVILCHALGLDLALMTHIDQTYGCLNIIDYFDGMPVVRLMNELPLGG